MVICSVGEERRGRLLHQLLVAPLERAVAGRDHHDVAVLVGQALGLDVARLVEVLLHEALAAAERGDRLADRGVEGVGDLLERAGHLEPATAAAEDGLDRDRQTVAPRRTRRPRRRPRPGPWCRGPAGRWPSRRCAGLHLVAERLDRLRRRTDPDQAGVDHGLGEVAVLGQEAVAGVHRVGAGLLRRGDDLADVEVGVPGRRAVERVRLVGEPHEQRVAVGLGIDGDTADAGVPTGADHADGDLAAVGDQDFLQRCGLRHRDRVSPPLSRPGWPPG